MDNIQRVTIGILASLLMVIFVFALGDNITGYSVVNKEIKLDAYPLPFVLNGVYNDLYIVVPDNYTFNEAVAADKIALGLQDGRLGKPIIVTENRIPQGAHNLVIVGRTCESILLSDIFGTKECNINLRDDQGMIRLITVGTKRYLLVTSNSEEGILKSAAVLRNYKTYGLSGTELVVSGNINNALSLQLEAH